MSSATNVGGSDSSVRGIFEKVTSKRFGEKFETTHFIRAVDTVFAVLGKLFKKLPAESGFPSSRSSSDYVETRTKELFLVKIIKAGRTISVVFHVIDVDKEVIGKVVIEGRFFSGFVEVDNVVELALSVGNKVGSRANILLSFIKGKKASMNEFA